MHNCSDGLVLFRARNNTLLHMRSTPLALEVSIPTAADTELLELFSAAPPKQRPIDVVTTADSANDCRHCGAARQLLTTLRLQPQSDASIMQLSDLLPRLDEYPVDTQADVLEHAVKLDPTDSTLLFTLGNMRMKQYTQLTADIFPGSQQTRHFAAVKHARSKWLSVLRRLDAIEEGRNSSHVQQSMGALLFNMGLYNQGSDRMQAALELQGLNLQTGESNRSLMESEHLDAKRCMAALDLSLAHEGRSAERAQLQQLGVNMGFWRRHDQRPPASTRPLFGCPFYDKARFRLVRSVEAAAVPMREEMMTLLRRRLVDFEEADRWYHDNERIARRPSQWLRRHVDCPLHGEAPDTPETCRAVRRAMSWYYASPHPGGEGAPVEAFYLRVQFSILAPGAHILPHVGPTNERLAISLGLAGVGHAKLRVGDTWKSWNPGEAILFDDSFEHEVVVGNECARAVAIIHLKHPELMPQGTHGARIAEDMAASCLGAPGLS